MKRRTILQFSLAFLAQQGFRHTRVLSMVGWFPAWKGLEIAPVSFTHRAGHAVAAWADHRQALAGLVDWSCDRFGLRTQITLFADAQLLPRKADRVEHLRRSLAEVVAGRKHKIILFQRGSPRTGRAGHGCQWLGPDSIGFLWRWFSNQTGPPHLPVTTTSTSPSASRSTAQRFTPEPMP